MFIANFLLFFWFGPHRLLAHRISVRQYIYALLNSGEIISAPLNWRTEAFLRKWRCGAKLQRKL